MRASRGKEKRGRDRFGNAKGMHNLPSLVQNQPPLLGLERGLKRRFCNVESRCTHCGGHLIALENLPSFKWSALGIEGYLINIFVMLEGAFLALFIGIGNDLSVMTGPRSMPIKSTGDCEK